MNDRDRRTTAGTPSSPVTAIERRARFDPKFILGALDRTWLIRAGREWAPS
jgi:hypothetical protein